MSELMAVEAALFSAGRALDATEAAEATGLSRNKALGALEALVELYKTREGALEIVKLGLVRGSRSDANVYLSTDRKLWLRS